jgi:histidinol-phosphate aminotransferase
MEKNLNKIRKMSKRNSRRDWFKKSLLVGGTTLVAPHLIASSYFNEQEKLRQASNNILSDDVPIWLNSNENPYGPAESTRHAIIESINEGNRYPRNAISALAEKIAKKEGLKPQNVLVTAGSSEILGLLGLYYGLQKGKIIAGYPTFDFVMYFAKMFGGSWDRASLNNFHFDLEKIGNKVDSNTKLVFICNPNNPTGTYLDKDMMDNFVKSTIKKSPIFVDEAYIEFTDGGIKNSMAKWVSENENLIVGRTFSKIYGMAGLRIGYALAHEKTVNTLRRHLQGRSVTANATAVRGAAAVLDDKKFTEHTKTQTNIAKDLIYKAFDDWGVDYVRSHTSFVWFRSDRFKKSIRGKLQDQNIFIRDYSDQPGFARVSIGTVPEIKTFIENSKRFLV